jgi:predicted ester cyclase
MKKILLGLCAGMFFLFTSCNNSSPTASDATTDNSQTQKNIEATHVVMKAFETGDASGVDSVVADDLIDHTDHGDVKGKDSLKAMINMMHANMKDMKQETIKELADNDYVFSWMRFSGTSNGAMGMPPGPFDFQSIEAVKCRDGKIVEHWGFMEASSMTKMMQAMANMNKMDTTKKK